MKLPRLAILFCAMLAACVVSAGPDEPATAQSPRFEAVGVYIDPHGKPLAAYQFELVAEQGNVELVGIQGGDHPAYVDPPYYDTHALLADRIVVAAFNTGSDLPANKTRIATLMVRVGGNIEPKYNARLQVAASSDAKPIAADLTVEGVNP
jgi:hypothetical protein